MGSGEARHRIGGWALVWTVLSMLSVPGSAAALDRFVDDDAAPGGIGISWASAFDDLQDALAVAGVGDTIHVARGTYFPTSGVSRTATFSIPGGVTLRGGYAGVLAGNPNIRDPQAFPTILSGAIGNATDTDNSYTIVTASGLSSAVTIEGFTLTGGNANGASPFSALGRGGAVWISGVPSVAIHDCHFEGNQSNGHGGAIYVSTADLTLTDSSFTDNSSAAGSGGAMYVSFAILLVRGTSFDVNSATDGGALLCTESFCTIVNSTFNDNDAGRGGALLLTESTTELVNTTLIGNTAGTAGGAMFHENGELSLIHTTVMGNHVVSDGGLGGAGLLARDDFGTTTATIVSSIFWSNTDSGATDDLTQIAGATLDVSYTCVEDTLAGDGSVISGTGNIDLDPLFSDGDGRLNSGSPCADAGDNDSLPLDAADVDGDGIVGELLPFDLDNRQRRTNDGAALDVGNAGALGLPIVDMGAFEVRTFSCLIDVPEFIECAGSSTSLPIDGSPSSNPDNDPLAFDWEIGCVPGSFTNSILNLDVPTMGGCPGECLITLTLDDGSNPLFDCTATVTIADTRPPTATNDFAVTNEDESVTIDVLDNDSDLGPPVPLVVDAFTDPAHGSLALGAITDRFTYFPETDFSGEDTFTYTIRDNAGNADTATVTIDVVAVADAPLVSVMNSSGDEDTALPLPIAAELTDTDGSEVLTVTLVGVPAGATLSAGTNGGGGQWTVAEVDLPGLTVTLALNSHDDFSLDVIATARETSNDDEATTMAVGTLDVTVRAIDDFPELTVPGARTVNEDTVLPLDGLGVADVDLDEGGGELQLTLVALHGTLTLGSTDDLDFAIGNGTADPVMTFTASLVAANAALDGLSYLGDLNYNGGDLVTISVDDLGNTGFGGPGTDLRTIAITVIAVNDPPVADVPDDLVVNEDTDLAVTGLHVADLDIGGDAADIRVRLTVIRGTLTLATTDGVTFSEGGGADEDKMTFEGTLNAINAALAVVTYRGAENFNGDETITLTVNDLGEQGLGGPLVVESSVAVTVAPVNDPPVAVDDPIFVTDKMVTLIFSELAILTNDTDVDGDKLEIFLINQPENGKLVASSGSPILFTFTPKPGFQGIDRFSYTVTDTHGGIDTAIVSIAVGQAGTPDTDGDGVMDDFDLCDDTPSNELPDGNGCSASQRDGDDDGLTDDVDQCPGTPDGEPVDEIGCGQSQRDDDADGIVNSLDLCPDTRTGAAVTADGCSATQLTTDAAAGSPPRGGNESAAGDGSSRSLCGTFGFISVAVLLSALTIMRFTRRKNRDGPSHGERLGPTAPSS